MQTTNEGIAGTLKELDTILKLDRNDADAITEGSIAFPPNIDRKRVEYAGKILRARQLLGLSTEVNREGLLDPGLEAFRALQKESPTTGSPA